MAEGGVVAPSLEQLEEGRFVLKNLAYIEQFFTNIKAIEHELTADAREQLRKFRIDFSDKFASDNAVKNVESAAQEFVHESCKENGAIPKKQRPALVNSAADSLNEDLPGDARPLPQKKNSTSQSEVSAAMPRLVGLFGQQPDLNEWYKLLERIDQRREAKLEIFDEEGGMDLRRYLKKFETYCEVNIRGNRDDWVGELECHLQGKTLSAFKAMKDVEDSFDCIKGKLVDWYDGMKDVREERYKANFKNATRDSDESMNLYATRLQRLFKLAYPLRDPEVNRTLQEKYASTVPKKFRKMLDSQIMTQSMNEQQITWSRIIKCARHYDLQSEKNLVGDEIIINVSQRSKQADSATQCETCDAPPYSSYMTQYNNNNGQMNRRYGDGNQMRFPRGRTMWRATNENNEFLRNMEKRCSHCRRLGHVYDDCRMRWNLCYVCGAEDHFLRDCPKFDSRRRTDFKGKRSLSQPARQPRQPRRDDTKQGSSTSLSLNNATGNLNSSALAQEW